MRKVCILTLVLGLSSALAVHAQVPSVEMVSIKGGEFLMGSPESEFERQKDETQHKVKVNVFLLSKSDYFCSGQEKKSVRFLRKGCPSFRKNVPAFSYRTAKIDINLI